MFVDPSRTINLVCPSGWALDVASSRLTELIFTEWSAAGTPGTLVVRIQPRRVPVTASPDEWRAAVEQDLPAVARTEPADDRAGSVLLVEPARSDRPDQRWAFVHGERADVMLEHVGVPGQSPITTAVLTTARTGLWVGINATLPAVADTDWPTLMTRCRELLTAGHPHDAAAAALSAYETAVVDWLRSLAAADAGDRAILAAGEALLAAAAITGDLTQLADGTQLLARVRFTLADDPDALTHLDALDSAAMRLHGQIASTDAPANQYEAGLLRVRTAVDRIGRLVEAATASGQPAPGWELTRLGLLAVSDAAQSVVLSARTVTRAADGQMSTAPVDLRIKALDHLAGAAAALSASRASQARSARTDTAREWLLASKELVRLDPTPLRRASVVQALSSLADARLQLGDDVTLAEAATYLAEARAAWDDPDGHPPADPETHAQILFNSAWVAYRQHDLPAALDWLTRAEPIAPPKNQEWERKLASLRSQILVADGRTEDAVRAAETANAAGPDNAVSAHRLNLALAYRAAGRTDAAVEAARQGLAAELAENPFSELVVRLLFVLGALLEPTELDLALRLTAVAEDLVSYQRRAFAERTDVSAFDDAEHHRQLAASLVLLRWRAGDTLGALAAADRARARTLDPSWPRTAPGDDSLAVARADPGAPVAALLDDLDRVLQGELAARGVPPALSGAAIVDRVAASGRTTFLLHPTAEGLLRFVLRPGEPPVIELAGGSMDAVYAATDQLREWLGITLPGRGLARAGDRPDLSPEAAATLAAWATQPAPAAPDPDARLAALQAALADAIFGDQLRAVPAHEPIAIVPYRELSVIPLATLPDQTGAPLATAHPLSVLPSVCSMPPARPSHGRGPEPDAIVFGNPALDPALGLEVLGGAEAEAEAIGALLGHRATVYVGPAASEANLHDDTFGRRLVHLATHAEVRDGADESRIYLAPGPPGSAFDGILRASEVEALVLGDALVVLSACETGLGRAQADGIQGVGQAFLRAGARAVVLSLWRVDDIATAALMSAFYRGLVGQPGAAPLDAAAALAGAQAQTRATHPAISQWGPWLLIGDGGWTLD